MIAQNLSHEVCGVIIKCGTVRSMCRLHARSAPRNRRSPRRHWCTCCACRSSCCLCGAVVRRTLVLVAFIVAFVFVVVIVRRILLCWRYSVYRCCCVGFGPHLSHLATIEDVRYYGAMKASKTFKIRFITSWLGRINFQTCRHVIQT